MNTGWIKIHRTIQNHWIFKDPFYRWWCIILFQANHKEKKITLGYNIYKIKIGQCANSIRTWAKLFDCSTKQVEKFFKMLESDNMITREILGKGKQSTTLINISNYKKYQHDEETQSNTQDTTQQTTQEERNVLREVGTTKEYIEYKNNRIEEVNIIFDNILMSEIEILDLEKKFSEKKIVIDSFKIALEFQKLFIKNLKEKNSPTKNQEKATFKNYVNPIRLMFEKDEVTREQLLKVYNFLNSEKSDSENFSWKSVILSTSKLRAKFQQLSLKANEEPSNNPKPKFNRTKQGATYSRSQAINNSQAEAN